MPFGQEGHPMHSYTAICYQELTYLSEFRCMRLCPLPSICFKRERCTSYRHTIRVIYKKRHFCLLPVVVAWHKKMLHCSLLLNIHLYSYVLSGYTSRPKWTPCPVAWLASSWSQSKKKKKKLPRGNCGK